MKSLSSFIDKVCTKLDFERLFSSCLDCLDWRPVTEESQLNASARAGKQIKSFMFLLLCFLVLPYNKHLINQARYNIDVRAARGLRGYFFAA